MADPLAKVVMSPNLLANLRAVSPNIKRSIMRPAFRKGAAVVARAAKKKVPVRFGYLKKSIKYAASRSGTNARVYVQNKAFEEPRAHTRTGTVRPANYAHLVEFGTRDAAPHPFMRPALSENRAVAMSVLTLEAKRQFDKKYLKKKTEVV